MWSQKSGVDGGKKCHLAKEQKIIFFTHSKELQCTKIRLQFTLGIIKAKITRKESRQAVPQ